MSRDKKSLFIKYLVCVCIAVSIMFVVFLIQGLFNSKPKDTREILRILQNGFCIPGLLMMLFSGLMFVSDEGGFLGISYVFGRALRVFIPIIGKDPETYAQYRERKAGKKGTGNAKLCVLITGAAFFLISMIILIVWYNVV